MKILHQNIINCVKEKIMSAIELRKKLIEKIRKTENEELPGEIYRLRKMEASDILSFMKNLGMKYTFWLLVATIKINRLNFNR